MRVKMVASALAVLLSAGTGGAAPAQVAAKPDAARAADMLQAAGDAAATGDCGRAAKLAGTVADAGAAAVVADTVRSAAAELAAVCETRLGRDADAYRHALAATALAEATDNVWRLRLGLELQRGDDAAAVATVEAMARGRGAAMNALPLRLFYEFDHRLDKAGALPLRRRLLSVLADGGYAPDEPGLEVDGLLQSRAEMLHKDGDLSEAAAIVRRVEHPAILLQFSLDPRFRAMLPPAFDLRASGERALVRARTDAARHPDLIAPVNDIAAYLRLLGRPQDAVDAMEALRPRIDDPAAFGDRGERLIWWWDGLSRSYAMLGRYDQAVAALRNGGQAEETGGLNVSQVINLAEMQRSLNRPSETLATLRAFEDGKRNVSPYGAMQIALNRGCAKAMLGTSIDAASDLAFAKAHAADAPDALFGLLLCTGDLDAAAAALIGQLNDPERRTAALRTLSDFDDPPVALPPAPDDAALRLVKARPDVRTAVARAGGTRRFHVQDVRF